MTSKEGADVGISAGRVTNLTDAWPDEVISMDIRHVGWVFWTAAGGGFRVGVLWKAGGGRIFCRKRSTSLSDAVTVRLGLPDLRRWI